MVLQLLLETSCLDRAVRYYVPLMVEGPGRECYCSGRNQLLAMVQ